MLFYMTGPWCFYKMQECIFPILMDESLIKTLHKSIVKITVIGLRYDHRHFLWKQSRPFNSWGRRKAFR